ncbi:MAG TPA: hypothetical protein VIL46_09595, partial [Gemmataceae bacterium]
MTTTHDRDAGTAAAAESSERLGVAVVGCGYWGPNLIRNFTAYPGSRVVMLCDRDRARLEHCSAACPRAELV